MENFKMYNVMYRRLISLFILLIFISCNQDPETIISSGQDPESINSNNDVAKTQLQKAASRAGYYRVGTLYFDYNPIVEKYYYHKESDGIGKFSFGFYNNVSNIIKGEFSEAGRWWNGKYWNWELDKWEYRINSSGDIQYSTSNPFTHSGVELLNGHYNVFGPLPTVPLSSPTNNSEDNELTIQFNWNDPGGYQFTTVTYDLSISCNSILFYEENDISGTTHTVSGFENDKTYDWKVRAHCDYGESDWSSEWSFETKSPLPPPLPAAPNIAKYNHPDHPKIGWFAVDDADGYKVYRSITDFPGNPNGTYYQIATITSTNYIDSECLLTKEKERQAYYKVKAYNSTGDSPFSNLVAFTVTVP